MPGGGVALIRASKKLVEAIEAAPKGEYERIGLQILLAAIKAPLWQIADNAGEKGDVVVRNVVKAEGNQGWDATSHDPEKMVDMIAAGIVDPAKVTRSALQNAASVAVMILTTEAAITESPKEEKPGAPGAGGMGDMY
ncbi:MAG: hypothetical protein EBY28_16845 [Betaproteobacteria bacterium]|nr:hypothetical protein [Betaproteobacteria bacterium]